MLASPAMCTAQRGFDMCGDSGVDNIIINHPKNLDRLTKRKLDLDPSIAIFKGLINAILIICFFAVVGWSMYGTYQFYKTTTPVLAIGSWSKP